MIPYSIYINATLMKALNATTTIIITLSTSTNVATRQINAPLKDPYESNNATSHKCPRWI
nr:hypothetical protein Q903MT_gene6037 [Picea sitchensis]